MAAAHALITVPMRCNRKGQQPSGVALLKASREISECLDGSSGSARYDDIIGRLMKNRARTSAIAHDAFETGPSLVEWKADDEWWEGAAEKSGDRIPRTMRQNLHQPRHLEEARARAARAAHHYFSPPQPPPLRRRPTPPTDLRLCAPPRRSPGPPASSPETTPRLSHFISDHTAVTVPPYVEEAVFADDEVNGASPSLKDVVF